MSVRYRPEKIFPGYIVRSSFDTFFVQSCFDTNVNLVCAEGLRKECDYVKIIIGKGNQII